MRRTRSSFLIGMTQTFHFRYALHIYLFHFLMMLLGADKFRQLIRFASISSQDVYLRASFSILSMDSSIRCSEIRPLSTASANRRTACSCRSCKWDTMTKSTPASTACTQPSTVPIRFRNRVHFHAIRRNDAVESELFPKKTRNDRM